MYGDEVTEEQMELAINVGQAKGEEEGARAPLYDDLKQSIITNGGIIHPIIVSKDTTGKMLVIEGNTRTLIYRKLKKETGDKRWETIPAIIYESLDEKDIEAFRLQSHLVGPRPWKPYAKAFFSKVVGA